MRNAECGRKRLGASGTGDSVKDRCQVSGVRCQRRRWSEKQPVKSKKKHCGFVSVVIGLWERFASSELVDDLTAITRVIVARGHSHQPLVTA